MSMKLKKRKQTTNGYTGYVSFPLLGTETYSEFIKLVQYCFRTSKKTDIQ